MHFNLGLADVIVMSILFSLTIAKGAWVTCKANRGDQSSSFFLAGRSMPWWAVGLSIFASNIGTEHFIGQAGAAAEGGLAVAIYEWSAGLLILFLGFGLAPLYLGLDLTTTPQWFEKRFNRHCRFLLASVSLLAYVITKIAASLFAGALLFEVMLGVSMWSSVPVILVFTSIYAALGGLKAVMYTDVGQATVFLLGGAVGAIYALNEIGGMAGLEEVLERNHLSDLMKTIRAPSDSEYPWTGMLFGQPLASMWYWCVDQTMVQRVLSAKGVSHARNGCVLAGYLKILPPFLMVFPGLVARGLYEECQRTGGDVYPNWCSTNLAEPTEASKAYPYLIAKSFPDGIRGLLIVSMVLAMMSSLDSVFNCLSTVFTYDIYLPLLNPNASQARQIWVGRCVTFFAACSGLAWLPSIVSSSTGLYLTTQSAQTHMSPTLVAVFLTGLFWPRANGAGALCGMVVGFLLGLTRFITSKLLCEDTEGFTCMNFNHMGLMLFAVTVFVTVTVSLLTGAPEAKQLEGTTWWTSACGRESKASILDLLSGALLLCVLLALVLSFGSAHVNGALLAPLGSCCLAVTFACILIYRLPHRMRAPSEDIEGKS